MVKCCEVMNESVVVFVVVSCGVARSVLVVGIMYLLMTGNIGRDDDEGCCCWWWLMCLPSGIYTHTTKSVCSRSPQ